MALTKVTNDLQDALAAAQPTITSTGLLTNFTSTGIDDNATSNAITIDSNQNVTLGVPNSVNLSGATTELTLGDTGNTDNDGFGISFVHNTTELNAYVLGQKSAMTLGTVGATPVNIVTNNASRLVIDGSGAVSCTDNLTANGVTIGASDVRSSSNVLTLGGTSERMRIHNSGVVTMPFQPSFAMTGSHPAGWFNTVGVLNFATTITNVGGHYSTATKRFTAPVAGVYSISATVLYSVNNGSGHTYIRKNLQPVVNIAHPSNSSTGEYNMSGHTVCIPLAVNDYVDVHLSTAYSSGNGLYVGGAYSSFSGFLIG
jgi:hypothetical protein